MTSRVNAAFNSLTGRSKKDTAEGRNKQQVQSSNYKTKPSSLDVLLDNRGTTIITVQTKERKGGSIMVSSGSSGTKPVDNRKLGGSADGRSSKWSRTLREPNPAMKQGLQQLAEQMQSSKHTRQSNPGRKEPRSVETHKTSKYIAQDNMILDEIPVKQAATKSSEYLKTAPNSAVPSTTTIASSMETVEVFDRGVQCGFDSSYKFSECDPVRTLVCLMLEMEGLVKDEKSSKILTEMEQALFRIPRDHGGHSPADLEVFAKLQAGTASLTAASKKLDAVCAELREEKESLQQRVNKLALVLDETQQRRRNLENTVEQLNVALNESQQRERNLENTVEQLKMALNESQQRERNLETIVKQKNIELNENMRTISELKEKTRGTQVLETLITDLRRERDEQIIVAQQNYMDGQYLKVENEKLITLSSYKDIWLEEHKSALKALQNVISEQLVYIRESGERAKDANSQQGSLILGGAACSSPTSTSSNNSLVPSLGANISDISLSTVDRFSNSSTQKKKPSFNSQIQSTHFNDLFDDTDAEKIPEKTQLEFISLPAGDSSHTISLSQRKEDEPKVSPCSDKNNERPVSGDRRIEEFHSIPNLGDRESRDSAHHLERDSNEFCPKSNTRKSSNADKKQRASGAKVLEVDGVTRDRTNVKEEFAMMFQDIRRQSKFSVQLPSPPRDYPNPEWTDSSLPTLSGISDANIV